MDLMRNKKFLSGLMWVVCGIGIILVGCQLFVPQQDWNNKWGPLVPHTNFPGDCSICHIPERWDKLRDDFHFNHEKETGHRLEGSHASATCLRCHNDRGPVQAYAARGCSGCHQDPHASTLGMDCERCHGQLTWEPTGLVGEHARTRFPLVGVHSIATCESCHEGAAAGQFMGAPTQCEICHQDDLAGTMDPNHLVNGWISDCQKCHQPSSWEGAFVSHDLFPLVGSHAALDCSQCHVVPGIFTGLSQDCYSCHSADFPLGPNHVSGNYSHNCEECHSTTAWLPAAFDHSSFALAGGHAGLDCLQCHGGGVYAGLPTDCYSCHATDYQGASDHASLNLSLDCEQCHTINRWVPSNFSHPFPLVGNHNVSCVTCHDTGSSTIFTCFNCHEHRQSEADDEHKEVSGYSYNSPACYNCHPNGTH